MKEGAAEEMHELRFLPSSRYVQRHVLVAVAGMRGGTRAEQVLMPVGNVSSV
jgi:hypothetical protein